MRWQATLQSWETGPQGHRTSRVHPETCRQLGAEGYQGWCSAGVGRSCTSRRVVFQSPPVQDSATSKTGDGLPSSQQPLEHLQGTHPASPHLHTLLSTTGGLQGGTSHLRYGLRGGGESGDPNLGTRGFCGCCAATVVLDRGPCSGLGLHAPVWGVEEEHQDTAEEGAQTSHQQHRH